MDDPKLESMVSHKKLLVLLCSGFVLCSCQPKEDVVIYPETVFELSEGKRSADYEGNIAFWTQLSGLHPKELSMVEIGESDAGKPLHLILWNASGNWKDQKDRASNKSLVLINNGIHPGEPDGIDACQLLMLDILKSDSLQELYKNTSIAIIPVYNIGGALNRNSNSRANQNGPEEYGFRGNAQNLDLNRDCIKMDSKNAFLLAQLFHHLDPDIFFDTHVSNGADYQHVVSLLETQYEKLGGPLQSFLKDQMIPELYSAMELGGYPLTPYVNVWGRAPQDGGIEQFMDWPRYTNGLAALHHSLGFTVETHMLKPFAERVKSTKQLLSAGLAFASKEVESIRHTRKKQKEYYAELQSYPYHWEIDKSKADTVTFLAYKYQESPSALGDYSLGTYQHDSLSLSIPYYNYYKTSKEIEKPTCAIIPAGYWQVADRLVAHGVEIERAKEARPVPVKRFAIKDFETLDSPYEKHYMHYQLQGEWEHDTIVLQPGDYLVKTGGSKDRIIMETLLPDAMDSYFSWNFFDAILQEKEGFSPYVFDKKAADLLANDTSLAKGLQMWKAQQNAEPSHYEVLNWVYHHAPNFEHKTYYYYPVAFVY